MGFGQSPLGAYSPPRLLPLSSVVLQLGHHAPVPKVRGAPQGFSHCHNTGCGGWSPPRGSPGQLLPAVVWYGQRWLRSSLRFRGFPLPLDGFTGSPSQEPGCQGYQGQRWHRERERQELSRPSPIDRITAPVTHEKCGGEVGKRNVGGKWTLGLPALGKA